MAVTLPPSVAPSTPHAASAREPGFGRFAPAGDHGSDQAQLWPLVRRVAGGAAQNVARNIGTPILERFLSPVGRNPALRDQLASWITRRMWNSGYGDELARSLPRQLSNAQREQQLVLQHHYLGIAVKEALSDVGYGSKQWGTSDLKRAVRSFNSQLLDTLDKHRVPAAPSVKAAWSGPSYFVDAMSDLATEIGKDVITGAGGIGGGLAGGRGLIELKHFLERQGGND